MNMLDSINKLLPPYGGGSNDNEPTDEEPTCDHDYEKVTSPSSHQPNLSVVDGHFVAIPILRVFKECTECGDVDENGYNTTHGDALLFEPVGAIETDDWPEEDEITEYIARKELAGATNDNHPEPDMTIINESENGDVDPEDLPEEESDDGGGSSGPVRIEKLKIGEKSGW